MDFEPNKKVFSECAVCGDSIAVKLCTGCQSVVYCGIDHQRQDWRSHRPFCQKMTAVLKKSFWPIPSTITVEKDPSQVSGQCCHANQNFEAGALVFEEVPVFHFLSSSSSSSSSFKMGVDQVIKEEGQDECVTCGQKNFGIKNLMKCSKCRWPVCSEACEKAKIHSKYDCPILRANPELKCSQAGGENNVQKLRENILTARALGIRHRCPELWNQILEILPLKLFLKCQEFGELENTAKILENIRKNGKSLSKYDNSKFPLLPNPSDQGFELLREEIVAQISVLGRLVGFSEIVDAENLNLHTTPLAKTSLYKWSSYLGNSCCPNCSWMIGPSPDFKIGIRSAVPIAKGDALTINRLGYFYEGTLDRQTRFYDRFGRFCPCKMCSDPSELGTFQSAIVCGECCEKNLITGENQGNRMGYLVPHYQISIEKSGGAAESLEAASFVCNQCGRIEPSPPILKKVDEIQMKIKKIYESDDRIFERVTLLKKLVEKEATNFLHPHHWMIQCVVFFCQKLSGQFPTVLPTKDTKIENEEFYSMCSKFEASFQRLEFLIKILNKSSPGLLHERVRLLSTLAEGMVTLCKNICLDYVNFEKMSKEEVRQVFTRLKSSTRLLDEVMLYWQGSLPTEAGQSKHPMVDKTRMRMTDAETYANIVHGLCASPEFNFKRD